MIKGIGTDIVDITRIRGMIEKYGDLFLNRVYTKSEVAYCTQRADAAIPFAARWAAKEAFYKALPSTCQCLGTWQSVEVVHTNQGVPSFRVICQKLQEGLTSAGVTTIHLTLSHEKMCAVAFVIME